MLQIIRVDTLDNRTLDIELSNGNLILLDIGPLLYGSPDYETLRGLPLLPKPRTDGGGVHWRDGPSLTLEEILTLLREQESYEKGRPLPAEAEDLIKEDM